jgi:hypothetical protein
MMISLDEALIKVTESVKYSISWGSIYEKLCSILGDDFDGKMPFYENVDDIMNDLGFTYREQPKNDYIKRNVKRVHKPNKNQERLDI